MKELHQRSYLRRGEGGTKGRSENLQEGLNGRGNNDMAAGQKVPPRLCREQNQATETRTQWARSAGLAGCDRECGSCPRSTINPWLVLWGAVTSPWLTSYEEVILALPREYTDQRGQQKGPWFFPPLALDYCSYPGVWQHTTGDWTRQQEVLTWDAFRKWNCRGLRWNQTRRMK